MEMRGEMYAFFFDRKPINVREGHVNRQKGKHEFFSLIATIFLCEKMQIELQIGDILDKFVPCRRNRNCRRNHAVKIFG